MEEYRDLFVAEAREHVAALEKRLLDLEADPKNRAVLNEIFRTAHTIKGMSGTVGFPKIAEAAHRAETLLDQLRKGQREVDRAIMDLLLEWRDRISASIEAVAAGEPEPEFADLVQRLERAAGAPGGSATPAPPAMPTVTARPIPPLASSGKQPLYNVQVNISPNAALKSVRALIILRAIDQLGTLRSSKPTMDEVAGGEAWDGVSAELESDVPLAELRSRLADLMDVAGASVEPVGGTPSEPATASAANSAAKPAPPALVSTRTTTIRVPTQQLDSLVDTVGELVISKSRLKELGSQYEEPELAKTLDRIERLTTELYENVLKTRMLPMGSIYDRFPRMVRDLTLKMGKEVELVMRGRDTEIDRTVMEELSDPLMHLLRNCLDHGIESPEDRQAKGKPPKGTISVDARREHNRIILEISDDGRGIDPVKIRKKAVEKGFYTQAEADALPLNDLYLILCRPGFSTAEKVTETSGRGVGMDVVKTWVESLGGSFLINSELGKGTRMLLRLPLTLAIQLALVLRLGSERYALPLDSVEGLVDLQELGVRTIQGREVIEFKDEVIPIIRLAQVFQVPDAGQGRYAILVEKHGRRAGLAVDEVLGQREVVVKNLDRRLMARRELGGATILGDGRVALMLDIAGLLEARATAST